MSAEQTLSNPVLVLVDHENNGDGKWSLTAASEAVVRRAREALQRGRLRTLAGS